ncbi:MAG: SDR family NAD(P)-dependent oxidoreductase [Candidatus Bathyarchaeia archaeon]|jgi:nucleoside-diphosphate-sugar epimerase
MKDYSRVLVTGGAGFIGSHIVDRLLAEGFAVTVLDNFSSGKMENISNCVKANSFNLVRGDIRDVALVKKVVKDVDVVFHEAALVDVALSVKNPLLFNDVNVVGTLNLLKASVDSDVERFIFPSSAAVYGDSSPSKKKESMLPTPISPYGASKLAAENYLHVFNNLYGLQTVSLRCFNVYGSRQSSTSSYTGVITAFTNRLSKRKPPIIHGDGKQSRDFVNVDDVVSANMLALESKAAVGEVFNIASGTAITIRRLARILMRITNNERLKPIFTRQRAGDIKHCSGDISKVKKLLGFSPKVRIDDGLKKMLKERTEAINASK